MSLVIAQSITSAESNITSSTNLENQLKDDESKSEIDESESTTIVPEGTHSLSSIDSDEVIKTTFDRTTLVTAPHNTGAFLPAFEQSLHRNLLPLKTPFPTKFSPSSLQIPEHENHIIPGAICIYQVTLTHAND